MNYPNFEQFSLYNKTNSVTSADTQIIPKKYETPLSALICSLIYVNHTELSTIEKLPDIEGLWQDKRKIQGLPRDMVEYAHERAGYVLNKFKYP